MTTAAVNPIINKPRESPTRHWARSSSQNIIGADRPGPGRLPAHGRLPTVTGAKLRNKPAVLATRDGKRAASWVHTLPNRQADDGSNRTAF